MKNFKNWVKIHWWEYVVVIIMFITMGLFYFIKDVLVPYGDWALIMSFWENSVIFLLFVFVLVLITDNYSLHIGGRGVLGYYLNVEEFSRYKRKLPIKRNLYYLLEKANEEYGYYKKIKISYWKWSYVIENIEVIY